MSDFTTEELQEYGWVLATGYAQFIDKPITLLSYGHFILTKEQLNIRYPQLELTSVAKVVKFIKDIKQGIKRKRTTSPTIRMLEAALKPHIEHIKAACHMDNSERVFKLREFMRKFSPDELDMNAELGVWSWLSSNVMLNWDGANMEHLHINVNSTTLLATISDKKAFREAVKQIFPNTYTDKWFDDCYYGCVEKLVLTV